MKLEEFNYALPKELIAHNPVFPKDHSRLMVIGDKIEHKHFYDIIDYLEPDDTLVINQTKVKRCRLIGKKSTGSPAEIIILEKQGNLYKARIKTKNPLIGNILIFDKLKAKIVDQEKDIFFIEFNKNIDETIKNTAHYPFPTYIKRETLEENEYQPIFAKHEGSLAAPTASLHFTQELLKKVEQKGVKIAKVTLHIDFGTFLEITKENIEDHKMHEEYFEIDQTNADIINNSKGKLIAVGTTSLRTLEAATKDNKVIPQKSRTYIYIYPDYEFKSKTEKLITNFHLPKSTLLLLVSAFAGTETIKKAYNEAIEKGYRFYSLGDAMLLEKQ